MDLGGRLTGRIAGWKRTLPIAEEPGAIFKPGQGEGKVRYARGRGVTIGGGEYLRIVRQWGLLLLILRLLEAGFRLDQQALYYAERVGTYFALCDSQRTAASVVQADLSR